MELGVHVRIIDMNKFNIEHEEDIDINHLVSKELKENLKMLNDSGLDVETYRIKITEKKKFYEWILHKIFPMYSIEDTGGMFTKEKGHPDYHLYKIDKNWMKEDEPEEIFIEIKYENDGLSSNQFGWILKNRENKSIKLLFIKEDKKGYY